MVCPKRHGRGSAPQEQSDWKKTRGILKSVCLKLNGLLRSATFCAVCYFLLPLFLCSYAYPLRYRFPWILLAIVAVNHHQSTMTTCFSCQSRSRPRGLKGECPREEGCVTLWIAIVCTRGMCVCVVRACVLRSWFIPRLERSPFSSLFNVLARGRSGSFGHAGHSP